MLNICVSTLFTFGATTLNFNVSTCDLKVTYLEGKKDVEKMGEEIQRIHWFLGPW